MNLDNLRRAARGFMGGKLAVKPTERDADQTMAILDSTIDVLDNLYARSRQMGIKVKPAVFVGPFLFRKFARVFPVHFNGRRWIVKVGERTIPIWITLDIPTDEIYFADPRFLFPGGPPVEARLKQWREAFYIWLWLRSNGY